MVIIAILATIPIFTISNFAQIALLEQISIFEKIPKSIFRKKKSKIDFSKNSKIVFCLIQLFTTLLQYSLKFEGQANDPDLLIDCPTYPNLTFPNLITGQKYQKCINVINNDKIPHEIVVQGGVEKNQYLKFQG